MPGAIATGGPTRRRVFANTDNTVTQSVSPPLPNASERSRIALAYHLGRIQYPSLSVSETAFRNHLDRAIATYSAKLPGSMSWGSFLTSLYTFDWTVCCGCLEGINRAWELLFNSRTGRSDCLLIDALRARSCRLYPGNEERQESAVTEFWSHLIVSENGTSVPILFRYDGQRPLSPWLIRVFQNWHLSKLRKHSHTVAMPDDEVAMPMPGPTGEQTRWHELFVTAANDWLAEIPDNERLLLGLRWRYRMSQRQIAELMGIHEGTISRQTDKLRDHALDAIGNRLVREGWTGDDLSRFVLTEMASLLVDHPGLSADSLGQLLSARGKKLE